MARAAIKMRALSLSNSPLEPNLGSGKTVIRWTEGLKERGHEVWVAGGEDLVPWCCRNLPGRRFWMALGAWCCSRRQIKRLGPDLVEFYGGEFGLAAWAAKGFRRRPFLVAHTNGLELLAGDRRAARAPGRMSGWHRRLDESALACVDGFVAICDLDRNYVVEHGYLPAARTAVVEPGIDAEYLACLEAPLSGREHAVAFTGSWVSRKDPAAVVAVMERRMIEDAGLKFHVLGAPDAREEILQAFSPGVRSRVTVQGRLSNAEMARVLSGCEIFLFPSHYEGFGMATAEAMACGCAVVVTPTGFGGSLRHGVEARVCDFGDVAALSESVRLLLADGRERCRMASEGRARVGGLRWDTQVRKLEAMYLQWLEEKRSAGIDRGES